MRKPSVLFTAVLIGVLGVFMPSRSIAVQASKAVVATESQIQQMQLTRTLFIAVLKSNFAMFSGAYNPVHQARREYMITFINEWDRLIQTKQYTNSTQIFQSIKARDSYLSRHYDLWEGLINPMYTPKEQLVFEYTVGSAFYIFLRSENIQSLSERIAKVLIDVRDTILLNGRNENLALLIAASFENSEDQKISTALEVLKGNVNLARFARYAAVTKDFLAGGGLARIGIGMLGRLGRASLSGATAGGVALGASTPTWMLAAGRTAIGVNPFLRVEPIYYALGASVGAHAALVCASGPCGQSQTKLAIHDLNRKISIQESLALLWQNINLIVGKYPEVESFHGMSDFKVTAFQLTKEQVIQKLQNALAGYPTIDPLELILQAERIIGLDGRDTDDRLAFDFEMANIRRVRSLLSRYRTKKILSNDLEEIRATIMNELISYYRGKETTATSVLLNWGGNCQSRATVMLGLLATFREELKDLGSLGFLLYPDHVEPVLYNANQVQMLVAGRVAERAPVYRIEAVYAAYLEKLGQQLSETQKRSLIDGVFKTNIAEQDQARGSVNTSWWGTLLGSTRYSNNPYGVLASSVDFAFSPGQQQVPDAALSTFIASAPGNLASAGGSSDNGVAISTQAAPKYIYRYNPNEKQIVSISTCISSSKGCREIVETSSLEIYKELNASSGFTNRLASTSVVISEYLRQEFLKAQEMSYKEIKNGNMRIDETVAAIERKWTRLNEILRAHVLFTNYEFLENPILMKETAIALLMEMEKDYRHISQFPALVTGFAKNYSLESRNAPFGPFSDIVFSDTRELVARYLFNSYYERFFSDSLKKETDATQRAQQAAKLAVQNWLKSLKMNDVVIDTSKCDQGIQLPVASAQYSHHSGNQKPGVIDIALVSVPPCSTQNENHHKLDDDNLIRMTLVFEEGLHLWTDKTVNRFLGSTYLPLDIAPEKQKLTLLQLDKIRSDLKNTISKKYGAKIPKVFQLIMSIPDRPVVPVTTTASNGVTTTTRVCAYTTQGPICVDPSVDN